MFYALPRSEIVSREQYVLEACRGKRVIHLGAAQGSDSNDLAEYNSTVDPRTFLHTRITAVASRCVGIDYNEFFVQYLKDTFQIDNILCGNIEDARAMARIDLAADVIVMGEIIEHISNPGLALSNIRDNLMRDSTKLLVTMPNALDASNFLYGLFRSESHDPDHVAMYTPRLFDKLCQRVNLRVVDLVYYQSTISTNGWNYYTLDRCTPRKLILCAYYNLLLRLNPGFSNGLIAVAIRT